MNAAQPPALLSMAPLLFMLVIFYFLLIRPQQKQATEHKKMLEALKKGDRVLTSGGLFRRRAPRPGAGDQDRRQREGADRPFGRHRAGQHRRARVRAAPTGELAS